ncbi:MAG TPA: hypothetical protein VJN42_08450 [Candidatus Acidoferrum sp.]|nr:hypothetical protein [Candidatus Acidoferrum sp.]
MKALSKGEVLDWCRTRFISVSENDYLYFPEARNSIAIELPEKPYQLVKLANVLLPYSESVPFQGALLWIRETDVWDKLVERVGFRVLELMRRFHGNAQSMEQAPGYLFDAQELVDLEVCLVQPLLIGWDAFMVPESGDYIVATSHDETTCVLTRTPQIHGKLLAELQIWNPREDTERYFKGTAIPAAQG